MTVEGRFYLIIWVRNSIPKIATKCVTIVKTKLLLRKLIAYKNQLIFVFIYLPEKA
jgi:hypothetical protein